LQIRHYYFALIKNAEYDSTGGKGTDLTPPVTTHFAEQGSEPDVSGGFPCWVVS
jgi:hypothetical protein